MTQKVQIGLRVGEFSLDGQNGAEFRDALFDYLDEAADAYASIWIADHFFPWMASMDQKADTFEALSTIAYLLARYPKNYIGSIVLSQSYRNPALVAKMAVTLQTLSNGRFILGLGAGWKENEYKAYGYEYLGAGERIDQLSEAVQVIRAMFTQEKPGFEGKYYRIENAYCTPRPSTLPPIMIGGGGRKKTLRVVAQYADWWNIPGCTVDEYASLLGALRDHCEAVERDYDSIVKTWMVDCVAIAETHEAAEALAQASPLRGPGAIVGTPDEVYTQLKRYTDLGATHLMLRFTDFPKSDGAKLFARTVLPRFA